MSETGAAELESADSALPRIPASEVAPSEVAPSEATAAEVAAPRVAAAQAELAKVADTDVELQPERYRAVHSHLQAALADTDTHTDTHQRGPSS